MKLSDNVTGIQHIGIPTNDIEATKEFFTSLGFCIAYETVNEAANEKVCFLQLKNICIETYENRQAVGVPGAVDHIALDVADVDEAFREIKSAGRYNMLDDKVNFLPFWDNGVRFFTIMGPDGEKVEFSQML